MLEPNDGTSATGSTNTCSDLSEAVLVCVGDDVTGFDLTGLAAMAAAP
jgi:hypothetical protein